MHLGMQEGNFQRVYEQDYAFHRKLWEIADHLILLEVVSSLRMRVSRFIYVATSVLPKEWANRHVESHDELIDILKRRDVAVAQAEITRHILAAKERILTYCQLEPIPAPTMNRPEDAAP